MESADHCEGGELLVDEYRHYGRLRELLPEAGHSGASWPGGEPARGCNLSFKSRRRKRETLGRGKPVHDSLREGWHATSPRILVHHTLRLRRLPGGERPEPFCREQLDAVQVQR